MGLFDVFKKDKENIKVETNTIEGVVKECETKSEPPKKSSKRKTLVKEFEQYVRDEDDHAIREVFKKCDINAYGGIYKTNALGFMVSENVIRWLVEAGADIEFEDAYRYRPLHHHAGNYNGHLELLISLGADVEAKDASGRTPLFHAIERFNAGNVKVLIYAGANINATDSRGKTPLLYALSIARNADIKNLIEIVKILLNEGAEKTELEVEQVKRIGSEFEQYREAMSQEVIGELEPALNELYEIFDIQHVPKRKRHDGRSEIKTTAERWQDQYNELWEMLVPASGTAETVQGEVIRICGAISYEILDNGGINWCDRHQEMCRSLLDLLSHHDAVMSVDKKEIGNILSRLMERKENVGDIDRLVELVTGWVMNNITPIKV